MKARVTVFGHSLHAMLVAFPIGLLATSLVWDVCRLATGAFRWGTLAFWSIVAGVVGALLAAVPGFIDWLGLPAGTRAKNVGRVHMVLNLCVVALFAVSLLARASYPGGYDAAEVGQMIWGWIGLGLVSVSAWLGGELVEALGVSVHEGANPNAPSSLALPKTRQPSHGPL
jgi:uncharacterized membrane protein